MDEYYLEFLKELAYRLETYEDSTQWADWMKKSANKYVDSGDLEYFFRAFGGMGGFYDRYFYYSNVTRELSDITCKIAKSLKENKDDNISSILEDEKQRFISFYENQGITKYDSKELNYLNYLITNYKLGNLHDITEKYNEEKVNKKRQSL